MKVRVTLLVLVLLAGCASRQLVQFPDQRAAVHDPQKARIYVMRSPNFWRFNLASLIRRIRVVDGAVEIGFIAGQRGFLSWEREPGDTTVSVPGEAYLSLTVEQGGVYYILVRDTLRVVDNRMTVELTLVDEDRGQRVLGKATPPK